MKKTIGRSFLILVFCSILLFIGSSIALAEDSIYKLGFINASTISISDSTGDSENKIGTSFAFYVERALEINEQFELGYGGGFQQSGEFEQDIFYKNNCLPIYLLLNYYPLSIEGLPYITGHVGYNFMFYDVEYEGNLKGLYYALGAGIRIPRHPSIRAEVLYMVNHGSGSVENYGMDITEDIEVSLSRISLNLGLGF